MSLSALFRRFPLCRKRTVSCEDMVSSSPNPEADGAMWAASNKMISSLVGKYGKPNNHISSRTRRVLVYDGKFVIKIPTSSVGIEDSRKEIQHFRNQGPSSQVKLPITKNIGTYELPIIHMEYIKPLCDEEAYSHPMANEIDSGQLGVHPITKEVLAYDL